MTTVAPTTAAAAATAIHWLFLLLVILVVSAQIGPSGQPSTQPTSRPSRPTVGPSYFYRAPTPAPTVGSLFVLGATQQVTFCVRKVLVIAGPPLIAPRPSYHPDTPH